MEALVKEIAAGLVRDKIAEDVTCIFEAYRTTKQYKDHCKKAIISNLPRVDIDTILEDAMEQIAQSPEVQKALTKKMVEVIEDQGVSYAEGILDSSSTWGELEEHLSEVLGMILKKSAKDIGKALSGDRKKNVKKTTKKKA